MGGGGREGGREELDFKILLSCGGGPGLHKTLSLTSKLEAGEMAQHLSVLPEVLSSIPSNPIVAHYHL